MNLLCEPSIEIPVDRKLNYGAQFLSFLIFNTDMLIEYPCVDLRTFVNLKERIFLFGSRMFILDGQTPTSGRFIVFPACPSKNFSIQSRICVDLTRRKS